MIYFICAFLNLINMSSYFWIFNTFNYYRTLKVSPMYNLFTIFHIYKYLSSNIQSMNYLMCKQAVCLFSRLNFLEYVLKFLLWLKILIRFFLIIIIINNLKYLITFIILIKIRVYFTLVQRYLDKSFFFENTFSFRT